MPSKIEPPLPPRVGFRLPIPQETLDRLDQSIHREAAARGIPRLTRQAALLEGLDLWISTMESKHASR